MWRTEMERQLDKNAKGGQMSRHTKAEHGLSTVEMFKNADFREGVDLTEEQLAQLQRLLLEILQDMDSFCREYHICYYLGGGSALGAVRHKGFIPWDDDADVNMPRADYERFIEEFPRAMGEKYWLHTPEHTHGHGLLLARVRLKGTCVKTREDFFNNKECGAFVDVFVVDNVPDNPFLRALHGFGSLALGFLLSCRKFYRERSQWQKLLSEENNCKNLRRAFRIKSTIGFFTAIFPIDWWVHWNHWWNGLCKNENSRCVTVPAGRKHYWGEMIPREEVFPVIVRPFEGSDFCTARTELYLKQLYGDYMKIPKKGKREKHLFFAPLILERKDAEKEKL